MANPLVAYLPIVCYPSASASASASSCSWPPFSDVSPPLGDFEMLASL